jgi:uncharacterized protein YfeS
VIGDFVEDIPEVPREVQKKKSITFEMSLVVEVEKMQNKKYMSFEMSLMEVEKMQKKSMRLKMSQVEVEKMQKNQAWKLKKLQAEVKKSWMNLSLKSADVLSVEKHLKKSVELSTMYQMYIRKTKLFPTYTSLQ